MVKQKQQTCSLVVYNVNAKLLQQHQPARAMRVHEARGPAYRIYIKNFKCRIEIYITKRRFQAKTKRTQVRFLGFKDLEENEKVVLYFEKPTENGSHGKSTDYS